MSSAASDNSTAGALQHSTVGTFTSSSMTEGTMSLSSTIGTHSSSSTVAVLSSPSTAAAAQAATLNASTPGATGTLSVGSMYSSAGIGASSSTAAAAPFHFGNLLTVKLSSDNYLLWRSAMLPLMR